MVERFISLSIVVVLMVTLAAPVLGADVSVPVAAPAAGEQPGLFQLLMPWILIFGVIYFIMIRPQQKRAKSHQEMVRSLKKGDEVVTNGGLLGKVTAVKDDSVELQVAKNTTVKVVKYQIARLVPGKDKQKADDEAGA